MLKIGINSAVRITPAQTTDTQDATPQATEQPLISPEPKSFRDTSIRSEAMFSASATRAHLTQQLASNESTKSKREPFQNRDGNRLNKAALETARVPSLNTLFTGSGDDFVFIQYSKSGDFVQVSVNGKEAWTGTPEQFSNLKIDTGDGKDIVMINTPGANVVTGSGNDQVLVGVIGSQFDPEIEQRFGMLKINTGDGNDAVENRASAATILTGDGMDAVENFGNNNTIVTGEGIDRVYNKGNMNRIDTGNGNDEVQNFGNDNEIFTGFGDDAVYTYGRSWVETSEPTTVDYVDNGGGDRNIIDTGDGNDGVFFGLDADDNRILTASGNDFVSDHGSGNQIDPVEENDSAAD